MVQARTGGVDSVGGWMDSGEAHHKAARICEAMERGHEMGAPPATLAVMAFAKMVNGAVSKGENFSHGSTNSNNPVLEGTNKFKDHVYEGSGSIRTAPGGWASVTATRYASPTTSQARRPRDAPSSSPSSSDSRASFGDGTDMCPSSPRPSSSWRVANCCGIISCARGYTLVHVRGGIHLPPVRDGIGRFAFKAGGAPSGGIDR
jgi:hypothetical protein